MLDRAKSAALRQGLNVFLKERYGELKSFELDTDSQSLRLEVLLHGEAEPVHLEVGRYEMVDRDGTPFIQCRELKVSREWMNQLARNYAEGKEIALPKEVAGLAKLILT